MPFPPVWPYGPSVQWAGPATLQERNKPYDLSQNSGNIQHYNAIY